MGKPSIPPPPTPPTAREIADANAQTAEHMARLQSRMEFGEEMLKHEEGVRHERVGATPPKGYTQEYSDEEVSGRGPKTFQWAGGHGVAQINSKGEVGVDQYGKPVNVYGYDVPVGTHIDELREMISEMRDPYGTPSLQGNQTITSTVKTLTGYRSPDGKELIPASEYYRIETQPDGTTRRKLVSRDEAIDVDFTGEGDIDRAMKRWEFEKETSGEVAEHLLAQAREHGLGEDGFIDTAVEMITRSDPIGKKLRDDLGNWTRQAKEKGVADLPKLGDMADLLGTEAIAKLRADVPALAQLDLKKLPDYKDAEKLATLEGIGPAKDLTEFGLTAEELAKRPEFGDIGAMQALKEGDPLTGVEAARFSDLEFGERVPALEEAKEMAKLERAGEMGELEEVEKMAALERMGKDAVLDREELTEEDLALLEVDPEVLARRKAVGERLGDRAQDPETSRLMAEEARRIARGRAAATGNIWGGGAVIEEARAVRMAEEGERRRAREEYMRFQQSGETAADYEAEVGAENLRRKLAGIEQRAGAREREFGMEAQRVGIDREAALQERAQRLAGIAQRNEAEEREYQATLQALGVDTQAALAERQAAMEAMGQRTGARQAEFAMEMTKREQQQRAREADFQSKVQAAGFTNEATMRKRADELGAQEQRTGQEQQEFSNLTQIVAQINEARGGQFGLEAQQLEINTQQKMRNRADELAALAQRNQAQEAEYQDLLAGMGQRQQAEQAQFGMQQSQLEQEQAYGQRKDQQAQQKFAGAMQKTMSQEQLKQQQMANLQSFSGLAPQASQFGMMPGAQQAAASSFTPLQYQPTNAMGLLQGQQNLAASNFGTQGQMWGQQAQIAAQPSGFGQALGAIGGGLAGGVGSAWGASKWKALT